MGCFAIPFEPHIPKRIPKYHQPPQQINNKLIPTHTQNTKKPNRFRIDGQCKYTMIFVHVYNKYKLTIKKTKQTNIKTFASFRPWNNNHAAIDVTSHHYIELNNKNRFSNAFKIESNIHFDLI